jgi:hypothetical protein
MSDFSAIQNMSANDWEPIFFIMDPLSDQQPLDAVIGDAVFVPDLLMNDSRTVFLSLVGQAIAYNGHTWNRWHVHGPRSTYRPASRISSPLLS